MRRGIKFRAWDGSRMTVSGIMFSSTDGKMFTAADMPLMQYTGLKDKNGLDIYEGDIVEFWYEENFSQGTQAGFIIWEGKDCAYYIDCGGVSICLAGMDIDYANIKLIGNIHENPELLR